MKFQELKKELANGVDGFYIIKGKDAYLRQKAEQMISTKCVKKLADINITRYNDDNYNIESILTDLSAMPMIDDYRVVILKDLNIRSTTDVNSIERTLKKGIKYSVLIINDGLNSTWYKNLVKIATIVDCDTLDELMLQKIALKGFQDNGVKVDTRALQMLVQFCGGDLNRINGEVNKLSNYVGQNGIVTAPIVSELVHKDLEYNVFELSNAVSKKDSKLAIQIVKSLLEQKESPQVLLIMILSNFRRMFFATISKLSAAELAKKLGVKEYAVKVAKDMSRQFTPVRLKSILDFGADLDYRIKAGNMNAENALYFFITNISL